MTKEPHELKLLHIREEHNKGHDHAYFCSAFSRKQASWILSFSSSLRSKVCRTTANERFSRIWTASAWWWSVSTNIHSLQRIHPLLIKIWNYCFAECSAKKFNKKTQAVNFNEQNTKQHHRLKNCEKHYACQRSIWIGIKAHSIIHVVRPVGAEKLNFWVC